MSLRFPLRISGRDLHLKFASSHVERDNAGGKLVVRVTIDDNERQLAHHEKIFFSIPADFHVHNDLVAAALMAVMGRGFRSALFNFPISARCAELLPIYYRLEEVGPVDPDLEPRRQGRYIGCSLSGGLDSVAVWTMLNDVAKLEFKVISAEYEWFHREAVGYAAYHRDVSCWTNFRSVFGDRGRRFDAAIPLLFADYADLHSFVTGHAFGAMPNRWVDPRGNEPLEFLSQDPVSNAGGLNEIHLARCLHTPGLLKFLVATAPQRVETAFYACDRPGNLKHVMKGLMLQQVYREFEMVAPPSIANLVYAANPAPWPVCGNPCVWVAKSVDPATALRVNPGINDIDWSPIEHLTLDVFWRYCPLTAKLIPRELCDPILEGFHAAGIQPYAPRDYDELEALRRFVLAINPASAYAPE